MVKSSMQKISIGNQTLGERPLIAVPLTDRALSSGVSPDDADIIEIRVDMFSDLTKDYVTDCVRKIREKFQKPVITTIRWFNEGGAVDMTDKERLNLYKAVMEYTDAADIEIKSEIFGSVIKAGRRKKKTIIGSFHNFINTPEFDDFPAIVERGKSFKADIIKIAVMPRNAEDLRTITRVTLKYYNQGIITVGMGELGMASRIYLPLIGSLLAFASLETATAPGQLSLAEMKRFLSAADGDEETL
jgi:3-dehydroquinate dehydratase-1